MNTIDEIVSIRTLKDMYQHVLLKEDSCLMASEDMLAVSDQEAENAFVFRKEDGEWKAEHCLFWGEEMPKGMFKMDDLTKVSIGLLWLFVRGASSAVDGHSVDPSYPEGLVLATSVAAFNEEYGRY